MKATRTRFNSVKQRFELTKMIAAYIAAEKKIMINPSLTGWSDEKQAEDLVSEIKIYTEYGEMSPEEYFKLQQPGNHRDRQIKELESTLSVYEEEGRRLMEEENYEQLAQIKKLYDMTFNQLMRLKNGN